MEHIEQAGVHSGDSACSLPPSSLSTELQRQLREQTVQMAMALNVVGLMNVQFAIQNGTVFVLEVNPRASRTVPFVSKATGRALAKIAARCMVGTSLEAQGLLTNGATQEVVPPYYSVKEAVFPFIKFPGVDTILGPEMKSTGEVMGGADSFGASFAKAQLSVGQPLPDGGRAFISVNNADKPNVLPVARDLAELGFALVATRGTAAYLRAHGLDVEVIYKVNEGRPNIADQIVNGQVALIVNTPLGRDSFFDDRTVRRVAMMHSVPCITTLTGASATVAAIRALRTKALDVRALQDYYAGKVTA
jgi:carbamoyl-phosphate synthase large subunit